MRNRFLMIATASLVAIGVNAGIASAQEGPATGTPGEANCHGQRVSFGSSQFGITPKDRAGFNGISVQQFQERVRASCDAP